MASCQHLVPAHYTSSVQGKNVYKDQCSKCFDSPKTKAGIYVCLKCFNSFCPSEHLEEHKLKHSQHTLYLHIQMFEIPQPEGGYQIDKIAIGKAGGALGGPEYETKYQLFCAGCKNITKDIHSVDDKTVAGLLQSLVNCQSAYKKQSLVEWQLQVHPCQHTLTLNQSPGQINLSKCGQCELSSNLWLCLTCGHIGCARKNYDGTGGNNHGIQHHQKTKHPLVVKSGTITADGKASIHCYECGDEVHDDNLATHLRTLGINISDQKKTEKTILQLTLDMNLNIALSRLIQDGKKMIPMYGSGFTGIDNIGNSCYINSVLQTLLSLQQFNKVYCQQGSKHLKQCPKIPNDCFYCQVAKVATGLTSGKYSQPLTKSILVNDMMVEEEHQLCIQPYDFKVMIAKNHQDFSTQQQQDALEYLQFLFDRLVKQEKWIDANTTKSFQYLALNKRICISCNGVKINEHKTNQWKFPVPHPTEQQILQFYNKLEKESDQKLKQSKKNDEPEYQTTLEKCLDIMRHGDIVEANCPKCKKLSMFRSLNLFKTTPKYLIAVANRFVMDNWSAKKLNAIIKMGDSLNIQQFIAENNKEGGDLLDDAVEQSPQYSEQNVEAIVAMGFSKNAAIRALTTGKNNIQVASAWLFEHLQDQDINLPLPKKQSKGLEAPPEMINQLIQFGFTSQQARIALLAHGNNVEVAMNYLFDNGGDVSDLRSKVDAGSQSKQLLNAGSSHPHTKYELHGVIVHLGKSVHSGHYVSYIKKNGRWILFNDSKVFETQEPAIGKGYIFIYKGL